MSKLENEIEYLITWARCSPATAVTGAFSYAHIIFVLADPPSWSCLDPGATQCDANVTGGYSDISIGSFSKVVLSQGAVNLVFFGVFLMFLAFFHSKIWAKFHFGTFEPYK